MNPLNNATLEASQRLVDAGIVLETDFQWSVNMHSSGYRLSLSNSDLNTPDLFPIPAPSMSEIWRELPGFVDLGGIEYKLIVWKYLDRICCTYRSYQDALPEQSVSKPNPTDTLIDLLIWAKQKKK